MCDVADVSAQDYSILVTKIPRDFKALNDDYDEDLEDFLKNNILIDKEVKVCDVSLIYNCLEMIELEKKN